MEIPETAPPFILGKKKTKKPNNIISIVWVTPLVYKLEEAGQPGTASSTLVKIPSQAHCTLII